MIRVAAGSFDTWETVGMPSFNHTAAPIEKVFGPLRTAVLILEGDGERVCLVAPNLIAYSPGLDRLFQKVLSEAARVDPSRVMAIHSHNHTSPKMSDEPARAEWGETDRDTPFTLTPVGEQFFDKLAATATSLADQLQPISLSWAVGEETTLSYNRKGRRADGTTYLMREPDRLALGPDFSGEIDTQAPVVRLTDENGKVVAFLTQFNAHPATAYHPEHPWIHGEYPQIACEMLASHVGSDAAEPTVAFLQGCAGQMNSKGLLTGDIERAQRHGESLGRSFIEAAGRLQPSASSRLGFAREIARVPYAPLPSLAELDSERAEIDDFIRRAQAGDPDTMECVGLNFTEALSPPYRAELIRPIQTWNQWAREIRLAGTEGSLPRHLEMEVYVLRLGDVAIAGLPPEPFREIGEQIRRDSPAPLTIPCGYCNISYGYVPDSTNLGDREYNSSFHRYCKRPPYAPPAGDVLADTAVAMIRRLFSV